MIYRKICLYIQSETGRRFIETIFSISVPYKQIGVTTLALTQSFHRVLKVNPPSISTHSGMVLINSCSLLNSLYPFYARNPVNAYPKDATAYKLRGECHGLLKHYEKAITDYNQAIDLHPEEPEAYFLRGNAFLKLGKMEEADESWVMAKMLEGED